MSPRSRTGNVMETIIQLIKITCTNSAEYLIFIIRDDNQLKLRTDYKSH
jgi:hypothetical protein